MKLKVEAVWQASQKHFTATIDQESKSDTAWLTRPVGQLERTAKIKAYEIRNNAVLTPKLTPSKSLWEMIAAGRDNNDFIYVPIEKVVSEWDQDGNRQVNRCRWC